MTSPFRSSNYRSTTHPSPSYGLPMQRPPKPPIHNPYDKFTQPEFDAWIGGITGALKRALGQQDQAQGASFHDGMRGLGQGGYMELDHDESEDELVNDSFAEIKTRRAAGKGKARDPRDGPGFGGDDKQQPIEIDSEEEEEEDDGAEREEESEEEGSQDWDERVHTDEEEQEPPTLGESSVCARVRHHRDSVEYDGNTRERSKEQQQHGALQLQNKDGPEDVIVLSSDDEIDTNPPSREFVDEGEVEGEYSDGEPSTFQSKASATRHRHSRLVDEGQDEAESVRTEQGYIVDLDEVDELDDDDSIEEQPPAEDASFPPLPVDILDSWTGPKTYAKGFYSAAVIPHNQLSAHHPGFDDDSNFLTPGVVTPAEGDSVDSVHGLDSTMGSLSQTPEVWVQDVDGNDVPEIAGSDLDIHNERAKLSFDLTSDAVRPDGKTEHEVDVLPRQIPTSSSPSNSPLSQQEDRIVDRNITYSGSGPVPVLSGEHSSRGNNDLDLAGLYNDMEVEPFEPTQDGAIRVQQDDLSFLHWHPLPAFPDSVPTSSLGHPPITDGGPITKLIDNEVIYSEVDGTAENREELPLLLSDLDADQPDGSKAASSGAELQKSVAEADEICASIVEANMDRAMGPDENIEPTMKTNQDAIEETLDYLLETSASPTSLNTNGSSDSPQFDTSTQSQPGYQEQAQLPAYQHHSGSLPTPPSEQTYAISLPTMSGHKDLFDSSTLNKQGPKYPGVIPLVVPGLPVNATMQIQDIEHANTLEHPVVERTLEDKDVVHADGGVDTNTGVGGVLAVSNEPPTGLEGREAGILLTEAKGYETAAVEPLLVVADSTLQEADELHGSPIEGPKRPRLDSVETSSGTHILADTISDVFSGDGSYMTIQMRESPAEVEEQASPINATDAHAPPEQKLPAYQGKGVVMPVCADPSVADPTSRPQTPAPGPLLSLSGTPRFLLSPTSTPGTGGRPTPVSMPVPTAILKALQYHHTRPGPSTNGLFTPVPATASRPGTPELADVSESGGVAHGVATEVDIPPFEHVIKGDPIKDHGDPTVLNTQSSDAPQTAPEITTLPGAKAAPHSAPPASYPMKVVMRKATDPILFSDPYPYSLSTPGDFIDVLKDAQGEASEEDTEQDNSMTSLSTLNNEMEKENENDTIPGGLGDGEDTDHIEDMELRYPSEPAQIHNSQPADLLNDAETIIPRVEANAETNVDGDGDPDFAERANRTRERTNSLSNTNVGLEGDPFKLMGTNSTVAPGAVDLDASPNEDKAVVEAKSLPFRPVVGVPSIDAKTAPTPQPANELPITSIEREQRFAPAARNDDSLVPNGPIEQTIRTSKAPSVKAKSQPSSKRKRASSSHFTAPLTRSMTLKKPEKTVSLKPGVEVDSSRKGSAKTKTTSKSKGKEIYDRQGSETPEPSVDSWSSSGASTASRMLRPGSRSTSRASSIVSSAPSDKSSSDMQPSPTLVKSTVNRPHVLLPPLLHTHSHSRIIQHHHLLPEQPQSEGQMHRAPSQPHQNNAHPTAQPSSQPSSSPPPEVSRKAGPASSSPVTRSNCRYHKISLPRGESGPRVYFLVPGCSLGNRDLMTEEKIEDHGDATREDSLRIVQDIVSLDFDSYLIGILRQLVGVDLLREQEVYYLPQPGEDRARKARHRKTASEKLSLARLPSSRDPAATVDYDNTRGSPHASITSIRSPISSRAPLSAEGSTSTSVSVTKNAWDAEDSISAASFTGGEASDGDDAPKSKRSRRSPMDDKAVLGAMSPPGSETRSKKHVKVRQRKRGSDGAPYKPDTDVETELHGEGSKAARIARKRGAQQGAKRNRPSETLIEDEDAQDRKPKKQRTRTSGW